MGASIGIGAIRGGLYSYLHMCIAICIHTPRVYHEYSSLAYDFNNIGRDYYYTLFPVSLFRYVNSNWY